MKIINQYIAAALAVLSVFVGAWQASGQVGENGDKLDIANFGAENSLRLPENMDTWVFIGTTMGMTYFGDTPDPADPGLFSSVFIAPEAYEYYRRNGKFADGTVFMKSVRETRSSDGGFFMEEELGIEIHVKDKQRFPKYGFNFYFFPAGAEVAEAMPEDNVCVSCHQERAQFDNVFTQFYPKFSHLKD